MSKKVRALSYVIRILFIISLTIAIDTLWLNGSIYYIQNRETGIIILILAVILLILHYVLRSKIKRGIRIEE
ncbi:hypothetical protein [Oceanobacillus manasiensis]|uniref:hypothetical protein n=1 Tax=Oceanobacillus manasiensis TaxID=586413 RepID=UPI0005A7AC60|nr:hypothetical protein [Oceanobacillus manasiensis]